MGGWGGGPDPAGLAPSGRHGWGCPSVGTQRPLGVCGGCVCVGGGGDLVMRGVVKQWAMVGTFQYLVLNLGRKAF